MAYENSQIRELIKDRKWKDLKIQLNTLNAVKLAEIIEEADEDDDILILRLLNRSLSKEVFYRLSFEKQEQMIEGLAENGRKLSNLLNDLEPDDRTAFFEELPTKITHSLLDLLLSKEREIAVRLLGFPEDSIGRLMTTEYIAVKPHYTVEHSFEHIRKYGKDSETLNVIYIVDENWKLIGDIKIKELILASPNQIISELMSPDFVALNAFDDQETAVKTFQDYDRVALPVVNADEILIGIITVDDMMDVAEEESTEDFHKFGSFKSAISNPLRTSVFNLYKNRIFWLLALVFMNVFSGAALSCFENVIATMVSLIFFLPLLIGSGGNAGSQSATLMIRSLAVGDVRLNDWYKLIGRELVVSLLLGVTMALGVALIASFRSPEIIMVVSITMILIVLTGSLIGMLLPFIFTKLKLDPATASAPLITSIADICGVIIYFTVAKWYLGL
ncbi:MAG: magnesium transporter [Bacteroidales bacterium]|jgi:magnesium transporter|nr:magnesium transporter [Bacteroidales bacterium]